MNNKKIQINIPNILSFLKIIGSFFIPYIYLNSTIRFTLVYLSIFAFSDILDGFIARKLKQETKFGQFLDPISDRIFTFSILFSILLKDSGFLFLLLLLISREIICLPVILKNIIKKKRQNPNCGYIGKLTTLIQFISILLIIISNKSFLTITFAILTFIFGCISGIIYIYKDNLLKK